ncbi:hypothetical protein GSY74_03780 [Sulfurovum sp. bin170]|uniref:hypothetical protein n=1 Tax=Sulfurovum sp. bin170 TaxID=2695268 RepID=UPI0013E056CD|nr:hypothetical protein [Sulfurovum sp. bin170]NEW60392.1 hypothetical protein [Sulfurovum sp. bin170]
MFTITVDKECGCFKKSDFENNKSYESNDDALMEAQAMVNHMNDKFCQKHSFTLSENGSRFSIAMNVPTKADSGCCGGGHCS